MYRQEEVENQYTGRFLRCGWRKGQVFSNNTFSLHLYAQLKLAEISL